MSGVSVRVGAVDCGTNSIRLLVADVDPSGALTDVVRSVEVVRLGYGVDRTGRIDPAAMERMAEQSRFYSKESEPQAFSDDHQERCPVTDEMREAARRFAESSYRMLASRR